MRPPGQDRHEREHRGIGVYEYAAVALQNAQPQQHVKGEREVIDQPPERPGALELEIAHAPDADALNRLAQGDAAALGVLLRVADHCVHRKAAGRERTRRIKGQRRRGIVIGIKELTEKQDIALFHGHRLPNHAVCQTGSSSSSEGSFSSASQGI